ncbi:MAG: NDP-sugar synthase [bacterium]|nr:NDP-sugar synthase [bacterium]
MYKGLLLIGGLATRLLPLSKHVAKSLLPICDRELLHYQIEALARAGIGEIVLACGYKSEQISEYVGHYNGLTFHISEEPEPRGTAGAIAQAAEYLDGDSAVVLNADILSGIDISKLIATHIAAERPATITGFAVADPSRYGLLRVEGDSITSFSEKPDGMMADEKSYVNAGMYVLEPEVIASIPTDRSVSIERETFPQLIAQHGALTHYVHEGLWLDVGTFESYFAANFALLALRFTRGETTLWGERTDSAVFKDLVYISKSAAMGAKVDLYHKVVVMTGCAIGHTVRLENCILMPGARVGDHCALSSCIVGPGYEVASGSIVQETLLVKGEDPVAFFPVNTEK